VKYRKKPVVIEAWQWDGSADLGIVPDWLANAIHLPDIHDPVPGDVWREGSTLKVCTLEGIMNARAGDWIIRGVKGELYPCKPDIFAATYELVW
jgi:hypothetical protein